MEVGGPPLPGLFLFGTGAGTVMKVTAANLELDKARRWWNRAMQTLVAATQALAPGAPPEEERRDWAGLPIELLAKIAETHVARTEAGWAAWLRELGRDEREIRWEMEDREREGNCSLFVFAMVCKGWRKAQLKVGGPLRTRVPSVVLLPGSVALAKWALAEGCPRDDGDQEDPVTMAAAAAAHGHMELVVWLIQEQGFAMNERVMGMAAQGGNLELGRWLRSEGCNWGAWTCRAAALTGQLEVLLWLRANGCPWDAKTCSAAAFNGHLETLRWARENGCDWSAEACSCAAQQGYLEVLQWLRGNGCLWDAATCTLAAHFDHLETLRWAHENGCDWDEKTCELAALGGHLEILQWLRAEGCPWDFYTCLHAVEEGHVEVLRWARENGCPWNAGARDKAAAELGYTDDLGNLVDYDGNPI